MLKGNRFRELRLRDKYTHETLAQALNIGIRMVAKYEAEEADPSSDVISRMAEVFNVSTDYLLGRTDDPTPCAQSSDLTPTERAVLAALRRGDALAAIKTIIAGLDS